MTKLPASQHNIEMECSKCKRKVAIVSENVWEDKITKRPICVRCKVEEKMEK